MIPVYTFKSHVHLLTSPFPPCSIPPSNSEGVLHSTTETSHIEGGADGGTIVDVSTRIV